MSPLHVQSNVCIASLHVRSEVCIAPIHVQSKVSQFALHMDGSNADFALHMEGSHANLAPHIEWRHSFRDHQIAKIAISAYFQKLFFSNHFYLRSLFNLPDHFWKWKKNILREINLKAWKWCTAIWQSLLDDWLRNILLAIQCFWYTDMRNRHK